MKLSQKNIPLSIITICYNIKDEIEKTCQSIVNQTWQDFEWIVIDGGSTDGTVDILNKYRSRINVFISEKDKGVYNAMNKGIKLASGEWLSFMNGGDAYAANDVLEKVFKDKNYDADVLYGNVNKIYPDGHTEYSNYKTKIDLSYFANDVINHQSSFIKRNLFDKFGLYDEKYKIAADWEKWIVFMKNGCKFQKIDVIVADFMYNGISSNKSALAADHEKICAKYFAKQSRYLLFGCLPLIIVEEQ
ncbi:MAG: glycosyltransferase [Alphaproteobacteria bacterium]|nr:glycosyltransferase [Alphaproteobacteria bacterium]